MKGVPEASVLREVRPILSLHGEDLWQQELAARQLATALGKPFLKVRYLPEE
jgi:hypothetical protein